MKTKFSIYIIVLIFLASLSAQAQTLFKDIYVGTNSSNVDHLTRMQSNLMLFMANNGSSGVELFSSDGTPAGTDLIKDIYPGSNPSYPVVYHYYNGQYYFRASNGTNGYEFWTSDLTNAGTQMVIDNWAGSDNGVSTAIGGFDIETVNGYMVIPLNNGMANGLEIYRSDGTAGGTVMLMDIYPGFGASSPKDFVKLNNNVMLFTAYEYDLNTMTGTAREIWRTNATPGGTGLIKDINPGLGSSNPLYLTKAGPNIIFSANDGTNGQELWKTDGTNAGTVMIKDINPGIDGSSPEGFQVVGTELFFFADDGTHGFELWKTDGTNAGTVMVKDIYPGSMGSKYIIPYTTEMNGILYFNATDGVWGNELWRSDGTNAGTYRITDISPGATGSNPSGMLGYNGKLYFSAYTTVDGFELYATDEINTAQLMSFQSGLSCGCPADFVYFNNLIFFTADHASYGREMWTLDPLTVSLPVDFLSFEAKANDFNQVVLDWSTSREENNDYFEIERSPDGRDWTSVIKHNGHGSTVGISHYSAIDVNPMVGKNIYRLKQVDYDGSVHYSRMIVVHFESLDRFQVYPNPVLDLLHIDLPKNDQTVLLQIFNLQGQLVEQQHLEVHAFHHSVQMQHLPAGTYLIELNQAGNVFRQKFIKA